MVDKVLVSVDRSEQAMNAFEWALEEFSDAHLTVLHVVEPLNLEYIEEAEIESGIELTEEERYEKLLTETENLLSRFVGVAEDEGVEASYDYVEGEPSRSIVEYADDKDVDHIVMGSHGRSGLSRILLGSVAENVTRRSPVPVTVVR